MPAVNEIRDKKFYWVLVTIRGEKIGPEPSQARVYGDGKIMFYLCGGYTLPFHVASEDVIVLDELVIPESVQAIKTKAINNARAT